MGQAKVRKAQGLGPRTKVTGYTLPKLERFNPEQLEPKAMKGLPFFGCKHIEESRNNPDSDLYGYIIKLQQPDTENAFALKACEECAHLPKIIEDTVARIEYALFSHKTIVRKMQEQQAEGIEMVSVSAAAAS